MPYRRPARPAPRPGWRGVVVPALLVAVAGGLSACESDKVPIEAPSMSEADAAACASLVDALPDTVAGELRRPVDPDDAPGAAWGDPAIVLTCGAEVPSEYAPASTCVGVRGVGWFAPEDAFEDYDADLVITALTHVPHVAVRVPPEHRGSDEVLNALAKPVRRTLAAKGEDCL